MSVDTVSHLYVAHSHCMWHTENPPSPCPVHTFWHIASLKMNEIFGTWLPNWYLNCSSHGIVMIWHHESTLSGWRGYPTIGSRWPEHKLEVGIDSWDVGLPPQVLGLSAHRHCCGNMKPSSGGMKLCLGGTHRCCGGALCVQSVYAQCWPYVRKQSIGDSL